MYKNRYKVEKMNEMEDDLEVSKMLPQIEIGFDEHIAEIDTQHERFEKMRSYSDEFGQKPKYEPNQHNSRILFSQLFTSL